MILEHGGVRIAVIGITTDRMSSVTFKKNIAGLEFRNEFETFEECLEKVRKKNPDLIILLSHCGYDDDVKFASRYSEIGLIIGGHTHKGLKKMYSDPQTGVLVCQSYGKGTTLMKIELEVDTEKNRIVDHHYQLVNLYVDRFKKDPEMEIMVQKISDIVKEKMSVKVGEAATTFPREYSEESPMGRLITDAIREKTGADAALVGAGGIRNDFQAGTLTERNLYEVLPFGNELAIGMMSGKELLGVLENGISGKHGFLCVSGLKVVADQTRPEGDRILSARVNGKPLRSRKNYRIVTNTFHAGGGAGYIDEGWKWEKTGSTMRDALREYVKRYSPLKANTENRYDIRGTRKQN